MTRPQKLALTLGAIGIVLELLAVALLASERMPVSFAVPMIVVGMLLALVPAFMAARSRRR